MAKQRAEKVQFLIMNNVLCDMWNTWNTMLRPPQSFRNHNLTQELDSDTLTL